MLKNFSSENHKRNMGDMGVDGRICDEDVEWIHVI
jgi:hypothetical protein